MKHALLESHQVLLCGCSCGGAIAHLSSRVCICICACDTHILMSLVLSIIINRLVFSIILGHYSDDLAHFHLNGKKTLFIKLECNLLQETSSHLHSITSAMCVWLLLDVNYDILVDELHMLSSSWKDYYTFINFPKFVFFIFLFLFFKFTISHSLMQTGFDNFAGYINGSFLSP